MTLVNTNEQDFTTKGQLKLATAVASGCLKNYIIKTNRSFREVLNYLQHAGKIFLSTYRKIFKTNYLFSYVILSSLVQILAFIYLVFIELV